MAFAVCYCHCQWIINPDVLSSWAKLQISPHTFSSVEYGKFLIEIDEHVNNHKPVSTTANEKKYFYSLKSLMILSGTPALPHPILQLTIPA
jgi:hypothetical protein